MLLAALGFSVMGGAAKLEQVFLCGNWFGEIQLEYWFCLQLYSQTTKKQKRRKTKTTHLSWNNGTTVLYSLLYCILHLPLGTAMTYNLTSAIFIAIFSFLLFKEYHGRIVLLAVLLGFIGMLMVYKPAIDFPWYYHVAGLISGISSAIAYMSVNRLATYYDNRVIMLAFIGSGFIVPSIFMIIRYAFQIEPDNVFFINFRWPIGIEWFYVCWLGLAAFFGQYFVTKSYGADKAGIVSAIGYSNIIFSVFIGMALGDAFPDLISATGMLCIIASGVIISIVKWRTRTPSG